MDETTTGGLFEDGHSGEVGEIVCGPSVSGPYQAVQNNVENPTFILTHLPAATFPRSFWSLRFGHLTLTPVHDNDVGGDDLP